VDIFCRQRFRGFLCQQAIEKYLKAALFELKIPIQKTHNLLKLYNKLKEHKDLELDETLLNELCDLYIESRYPTDVAFFSGEVLPTEEDAFHSMFFSQKQIYRNRFLNSPKNL